jgi:hypothetical protein
MSGKFPTGLVGAGNFPKIPFFVTMAMLPRDPARITLNGDNIPRDGNGFGAAVIHLGRGVRARLRRCFETSDGHCLRGMPD